MPPSGPADPYQPQMSPPAPPAPAPAPPSHPIPSAPPLPAPGPLDSPSPIGLIVAGAGLLLLCVSLLLPRIAVDYDGGDDSIYFGFSGLTGETTPAVDASTVILTVALLAAVGLSAHRSPALHWPTRLSAVGLAAVTAAFTYHPITAMQQTFQEYEDSVDDPVYAADVIPEITVEADNGVYLAIIAVALLAASTFFMRIRQRPQPYYAAPQAPPAAPGTETTVTVTPG